MDSDTESSARLKQYDDYSRLQEGPIKAYVDFSDFNRSLNEATIEMDLDNFDNFETVEQIYVEEEQVFSRLPTYNRPKHYDLVLKVKVKTFEFSGVVKILLENTKPTSSILLNVEDIKIHGGTCHLVGSPEPIKIKKVTYFQKNEQALIEFDRLVNNIDFLVLKFTGEINNRMKGVYRTSFKVDDETCYAVSTQFEATDARRCLPCWDEPDFKATFHVKLIYENQFQVGNNIYKNVALSNTPVIKREVNSSENIDEFDTTPKMSTYLLAFVIGPLEYIEAKNDAGRVMRVYTFPGKKELGRYALDVGFRALKYYEEYFDIPYPLEKMDLVAIPDFSNGAMENWGLVTYRETALLFDPQKTSNQHKQYIAIVVAHELAHQWFGNLVTMKWWTHLWLNEGFASFMEFLCADHLFPEYDLWSQYLTDTYTRAMNLDSLHNSHPIEVEVSRTSEIDEIFDNISYNKGSSVIRMLYNYIGDASFRLGMKNYLNKFKYSNAATEDLWDSLSEASKKDIGQFMSKWTLQKGYPCISVSLEGKKLKLTQTKFSIDGKLDGDELDVTWQVPIKYISAISSQPSDIHMLVDRTGEIDIEAVGDGWIKLNPGTVDFYRTFYSPELLSRFMPAILDQSLPSLDRLGLQSDSFALCLAGKLPSVELLKLLEAFKNETDYTVWSSIDECLSKINLLLSYTDYQMKFHAFGQELLSKIYEIVTWKSQPDEKHTFSMLRSIVMNRLVSFGHVKAVEQALKMFEVYKDTDGHIPADLRLAVYKAVAIFGSDDSFDHLFQIFRVETLNEERNRIARALGSVKDPKRVARVIDFVLSDEVKNQDKIFVIIPMGYSNPRAAWDMFKDKRDFFKQIYAAATLLNHVVKSGMENFASEQEAQEVDEYFKANPLPESTRTVKQSIETIRSNTVWLDLNSKALGEYLNNKF